MLKNSATFRFFYSYHVHNWPAVLSCHVVLSFSVYLVFCHMQMQYSTVFAKLSHVDMIFCDVYNWPYVTCITDLLSRVDMICCHV